MAIGAIALLGDVLLDAVDSDNPTHSYEVTDKAVEDGANVSDHMKAQPAALSISGVVVGDDAAFRLERLKQYQTDRVLMTYTNRVVYINLAIENISTTHSSDIANGFRFNIDLKQVRIVSPKEIQITNVPPAVETKTKSTQNAGTKQTQKTGKQLSNEIRAFNMEQRLEGG